MMKEKVEDMNKPSSLKIKQNEGIIEDGRIKVQAETGLNELLDNEFALFTKTLNYHWNVVGPRFYSLHQFLEEQYKTLLKILDDLAERVRTLGGRPHSTMREIELSKTLSESPGIFPNANAMLSDLQHDHGTLSRQICEKLQDQEWMEEDPGTQDLLVDLLRIHEKLHWMIGAHLQEPDQFSQ